VTKNQSVIFKNHNPSAPKITSAFEKRNIGKFYWHSLQSIHNYGGTCSTCHGL